MAKNILVISCDFRETRAALIENGIIAELHIERRGRQSSTVGNVYLGKVTRVLPGLQAAFIDIGQERAAFLHVEDLIRPDDFDEYLAGGRKLARGEGGASEEVAEEEEAEVQAEAAEAGHAADAVESGVPSSDEPAHAIEARAEGTPEAARRAARSTRGSNGTTALSSTFADATDRDHGDERGDEPESVPESAPSSGAAPVTEPSEVLIASAASRESTGSFVDVTAEAGVAPIGARSSSDVVQALADGSDASLPSFDLDEAADDFDDELPTDANSEVLLDRIQPDAPIEDPSASHVELPEAPESTLGVDDEDAIEDDLLDNLDSDDLPGFTISDPGEPVPRAPSPPRAGERAGERGERGERGGRRRRGRRRGGERGTERGAEARGGRSSGGRSSGGREEHRGDRRGGGRSGGGLPGRISKSTPIREVVREGQEIIVQVTKDPIGTKGARCSSHISLPGRYVVYLPTVDHVGISKRIGNDKERSRLREAIDAMKPPSGGLIVRTVAEGLTKKRLKQDVGYLVRLWGEIAKKREDAHAPEILSSELDLVLKVARDLFTDEVDEVVIDDRSQYERLCRFVEMFAPDRVKDVKLYDEEEPIFDEYGIEDEIGRALSRKVPLPSGGYLIIDQAEALTAIDVNTGRFVGKGSKDMEETILKTNLEAVHEIAYQLRFRNIGGLIILDLIDMEQHKNREKVRRALEELLQKDKAKTTLNRISDLGLIEMTRKRTRESLGRLMHEPCFYCDGTGQLQSKETIAYEILREIRRKRAGLPGYSIVVNAHPAVADVLNSTEKEAVSDAENRFMRKITVVSRKEYHLEQFDLQGK